MSKEELLFKKQRIKKQIENEQKSIEEIDKMLEELYNQKWKPKNGECYFRVLGYGDVSYSHRNKKDDIDNNIISIGNYFKTREEANFEVERLKVLEELKEFSYEFSDEEWKNKAITKYLLSYNCINNNIVISYLGSFKYNDIYFKTREDAKKAIENIGEDRLKKYYFKVGR